MIYVWRALAEFLFAEEARLAHCQVYLALGNPFEAEFAVSRGEKGILAGKMDLNEGGMNGLACNRVDNHALHGKGGRAGIRRVKLKLRRRELRECWGRRNQ